MPIDIKKVVEMSAHELEKQTFYVDPMTDIVAPTLDELRPFTMDDVIEVHAPVWQLCDSRHNNPIANMGGILPQIVVDPMNFVKSYNNIHDRLYAFYSECDDGIHPHDLWVVVTGITPVLVSLINWCHDCSVRLHLLHYDTSTSLYREQLAI